MAFVCNNEITVGSIPTKENTLFNVVHDSAFAVLNNMHAWFTSSDLTADREVAEIVPPCQHHKCFDANFFNYCNGPEKLNESPIVTCIHNFVTFGDAPNREYIRADYFLQSIESAPIAFRDLIMSQQGEITLMQQKIEEECMNYNVQDMLDLDASRNALIEQIWKTHVNYRDASHPKHTLSPTCIEDKKWPKYNGVSNWADNETSPSNFETWNIISKPYPYLQRNAEFDRTLSAVNAVIRVNKKKETFVDFLHKYPRKGCWDEFKNGFCADNTCSKMHKTFHGDASIPGVTRPNIVSNIHEENWRTNMVTNETNEKNWRTNMVIADDPIVSLSETPMTHMTEDGVVRMRAALRAHFIAGEPIPVNPIRIEDTPTDPFGSKMTEMNIGDWANSMDNNDLPTGVEYLCLKLIKIYGEESFFGPGIHTETNIRNALAKKTFI